MTTSPGTSSGTSSDTSSDTWSGRVRALARERLDASEATAFTGRLRAVESDLLEALAGFHAPEVVDPLAEQLVLDALDALVARAEPLRLLDRLREVDPGWFLAEDMVGYVCYTDRFAGTLGAVPGHLDHLSELGVRYLHLMPLLRPREGDNDGGYAVVDYDDVDPRLGTMADLEAVAARLHERDIALCVDLVLNHTAREHPWAVAAMAGDEEARRMFRFFPDRTMPDAYEQTLPDVFPDMAPGSFTRLPATGEWVWTTFREFQWDLDWSRPEVLREMSRTVLRLANRGVDVLRLDAAPFLWKRLGTSCQNQPEAHRILQVLRAVTRLAAPGVVLKAEAIVGPDDLLPYLGAGEVERPECQLAYDNQLMVMLWSAMATRDVTLATRVLGRRSRPPAGTGWVSYVRCHDDIGWAVDDADARAVGLDPAAHRRFLADFYAGRHPGSFSRGADFQSNPATGDLRTCGMTASFTGLEAALETRDGKAMDAALRRLELLYAVAYSFGGIPLVYMGDELAMLGDPDWAAEPDHAGDSRWLHRPVMDWSAAEQRHDPATPAGRAFTALRDLAAARRTTQSLRSDADTTVLPTASSTVLAYARKHPRAPGLVALGNFSDHPARIDTEVFARGGLGGEARRLVGDAVLDGGEVTLPAWGYGWFTS